MAPGGRLALALAAVAVLHAALTAHALENGQALRPPMGWLSWERFRCNTDCRDDPDDCISERLIRQMADRLEGDGFADAGYTVVGIDDCWLARSRDAGGRLQADAARFPGGMAALAAHVHDRGLQFGIYGDIGSKTCGGFPGMAGSLELDAQTFADWGVDYLKVDGCYAEPGDFAHLYPQLGAALNNTGRPITYSCSWPAYLPDPVQTGFQAPYAELRRHCNLWRNWLDIQDSWDSLAAILVQWAQLSLLSPGFRGAAGPGAWNDPDMLIIGNEGLSPAQARVQMGMWAVFAAPLLMSTDLRRLSADARAVLLDPLAISINQDPLGEQGELLACPGGCNQTQLWRRRLERGSWAAAFLSLAAQPSEGRFCVGIPGAKPTGAGHWRVTQVLAAAELADAGGRVSGGQLCVARLQPTSLQLFHVSPVSQDRPSEPAVLQT